MLNARPNFTFVEGDIMNPDGIKTCIVEHKIDNIIHLAAHSNVDASFKSPLAFAATNVQGTLVILESAKLCSVKKFIQMSSYEAYGATRPGPKGHREDEVLAPINPYGVGEAAAKMLVMSSRHRSAFEMIAIRASNIYAPD